MIHIICYIVLQLGPSGMHLSPEASVEGMYA